MVLPMFISLFHKNISIGIILGSQSQEALLQKVFLLCHSGTHDWSLI